MGHSPISIPTDEKFNHGNGGCYGVSPYFLIPEDIFPDKDKSMNCVYSFVKLSISYIFLLCNTKNDEFYKKQPRTISSSRGSGFKAGPVCSWDLTSIYSVVVVNTSFDWILNSITDSLNPPLGLTS